MTEMTEKELRRAERLGRPSGQPRYLRKSKLKIRFKHRLDEEIARTIERLELLQELKYEQTVRRGWENDDISGGYTED